MLCVLCGPTAMSGLKNAAGGIAPMRSRGAVASGEGRDTPGQFPRWPKRFQPRRPRGIGGAGAVGGIAGKEPFAGMRPSTEDAYFDVVTRRASDSELDHPRAVNCKPCRIGSPGALFSGGSVQTISPSAVTIPCGGWRVSDNAVPGDKDWERRSKSPPRLMFSVRP